MHSHQKPFVDLIECLQNRLLNLGYRASSYQHVQVHSTQYLPETSGECSPGVSVEQLDGEALEGVAVWYDVPDGILELLVADSTHS